MTNFFEHQAAARRKTTLLVVYFVLAVVGLVASTYLLVTAVFAYPEVKEGGALTLWDPARLAGVSGGVLALVGGCTVYKVAQLSSGGRSVALMLGGRELSGATREAGERRLLNVVEEMSIASGVPTPPVYVLDGEGGINAFAAGYGPGDAVVAVSRGCLDYLTRDELQGVVAHEFSHILNGDMRLNIRLMGLVFGILGLALIGQVLMRSADGGGSSRRDSKGRGQLVLLGLGLYLLGLVGAFFGNLIKAAVSRQREYLADASAVQFTRNPDGIGGALLKIGGLEQGPNLDHPNAPEASHMFFADALSARRLSTLMATHPPLDNRVRRVLPHWDGAWPQVHKLGPREAEVRDRADRPPPRVPGLPTLPGMPQVPFPVLAAAAVDRAGTVSPDQTEYAAAVLAGLPDPVRRAAEEPFGARALVYGLLLDPRADVRDGQLARLKAGADPADYEETVRLGGHLAGLPDAARLPLVDLAIPALRRMSPGQYTGFRAQVDELIHADRCVSTFEFVLGCVLGRHLDAGFGRPRRPPVPAAGARAGHVGTVLSLLAWEGQESEGAARRAYEAGMRHYLRGAGGPPMLSRAECGLDRLEQSLAALGGESPAAKRRLLLACAACIAADRQTTVLEAELYRAIGDVLGCPIPPLTALPAGAAGEPAGATARPVGRDPAGRPEVAGRPGGPVRE